MSRIPTLQRRPTVEIAAQRHMVFARQLDRAVHHGHPLIRRDADVVRHIVSPTIGKCVATLRSISSIVCGAVCSRIAEVSQNGLPARFVAHSKAATLWKSLPIWKPITPPLRRQLLHQPVRHIARNVVHAAQSVMRGHQRLRAHVDRLRNRIVRGVRHVDHHAQPVHLADHGAPALVQPVPFRRRAAGIGEIVGPVVRRTVAPSAAPADRGRAARPGRHPDRSRPPGRAPPPSCRPG